MQETTGTGAGAAQGDHDFAALPVGARVGRYEITAILGQGGFGITYRARDEQLGREVAIKEYLPTSLAFRRGDATVLPRSTKVAEDFGWGRERFVSEGRTLASLHNAPGIVRVFDFMEMNGTAYIVMELVQGDTLESRLRQRGKLGPDEIDTILWPMLDGLEKVHGAGFVHRDIKPANILMDEDGRPTLIDFGASRAAMAGRTAAMTAIFTPGYAAAEQFTSAKQGPWTDIYGLSATLYHAITGAAPPSAFDRMLDDEYRPLTKLSPPGFKAGLLLGIDAGLAVRAGDRPQTIPGWRPLLAQATGGTMDATVALAKPDAGGTVVSRPPPVAAPAPATAAAPAPAPARSRAGLYALVGILALAILGGGGYFAFAPKDPQAVSVRDLKVEELEKVLEERRRADAEAAEKQRAEEEARQKAEADTAAKRAADDQLAKAEEQRKKAEEQLARLQAELDAQRKAAAEQRELAESQARRVAAEEARRKAEEEMAALRAAEDEARRRAAIETEAKKLAEEALAKAAAERAKAEADAKAKAEAEARQKAEADARVRAEAEARAKVQAEKEQAAADAKTKEEAAAKARLEGDKKGAEAAEAALRLTTVDRQRLQVALMTLGFNTGGSDGAFGPRSRQAIANWQKSRTEPETGFLTATQQQALLKDAAPAVAKFDDEQKKLEEDRKKAEEEAKAKAAAQQQAAASTNAPGTSGLPTGTFSGTMSVNNTGGGEDLIRMSVSLVNGRGSGTGGGSRCIPASMRISVGADGTVSGTMAMCQDRSPGQVSGRYQNGQLLLQVSAIGRSANGTLTMGGGGTQQQQQMAPPPQPAGSAVAPFDGTYAGGLSFSGAGVGFSSGPRPTTVRIAGGTGSATVTAARCGTTTVTIKVAADGGASASGQVYDQYCGIHEVSGGARISGGRLVFDLSGAGGTLKGSLVRGAAAP